MAKRLWELRARILAAVGTGFALATASAACAGESEERNDQGTGGSANGRGGSSGMDAGGAGSGGSAGSGEPGGTGGSSGVPIIVDGRPFVVGGESRLPRVVERAGVAPEDALSEGDTHALASRWLERARREHASVAAFSALALELLAVGAPAELLQAVSQAALDEIEHTRLSFRVASRFAGRDLVPGALDVSGMTPSADLADIAARAALEGCVLETTSAALAFAEYECAEDEETKAVLERIAHDEARHAELSYRLVAWAIRAGGARVRRAVAQALEGPVAVDFGEGAVSPACRRYGMLDREAAFEAAVLARRDVIEPATSALFEFS